MRQLFDFATLLSDLTVRMVVRIILLMAKNTSKTTTPAAEICLYGTSAIGIGYIARTSDGRMFGNGAPVAGRGATETVWLAVDQLRAAGVVAGTVAIFAPGGERMAIAPISSVPSYGSLTWQAAPVYVITAEQIAAAGRAPH